MLRYIALGLLLLVILIAIKVGDSDLNGVQIPINIAKWSFETNLVETAKPHRQFAPK